jgi:beta-glucuronidase
MAIACLFLQLTMVLNFQWINGEAVAKHEIGHLPFEAEITEVLNFGQENRVTVLCNNILSPTSIPQGSLQEVET